MIEEIGSVFCIYSLPILLVIVITFATRKLLRPLRWKHPLLVAFAIGYLIVFSSLLRFVGNGDWNGFLFLIPASFLSYPCKLLLPVVFGWKFDYFSFFKQGILLIIVGLFQWTFILLLFEKWVAKSGKK